MDHFERELARLMRDGHGDTPYEERHRTRLRAGVRARQRVRRVWMATGSVLSVAGIGVGLLLTQAFAQGVSNGPHPRPATSAESVPAPSTVRPGTTAKGVPVPTRASDSPRAATWPGPTR
ncbi:cellulase [Streptomyces sp. RP5T]|uniref:cellulase n=1 Tax=Streptomyces sp. RP5T TaxID=2490848 RepID=UPI000F649E9B|nr:cellulase [Streptomyces sp. RP5T]RRR86478.1 cellulase [Streptomyces sp. RP5T]